MLKALNPVCPRDFWSKVLNYPSPCISINWQHEYIEPRSEDVYMRVRLSHGNWGSARSTASLGTEAGPGRPDTHTHTHTPARTSHGWGQTANPKHAFSINLTGKPPDSSPHQLAHALHVCSVSPWPLQSVKPFLKGKQIAERSEEV